MGLGYNINQQIMYIIEVFIKWLNKRQTKERIMKKPSFKEVDEALTCEHNFMPVDSTGLTLTNGSSNLFYDFNYELYLLWQ